MNESSDTYESTSSATAAELAKAHKWTRAKFEGVAETKPDEGYLKVNLDAGMIQRSEVTTTGYGLYAIASRPLRIADRDFERGLHFQSEGEVLVHLPKPAKTFEAILGVDSNRVTGFYSNAGRGTVIATVEVDGNEVFRSEVLHEGLEGIPLTIQLNGGTEFVLGLTDAGGGTIQRVNFNQVDWAEARVILEDGETVWLDELPTAPLRAPYASDAPFSFRYAGKSSSEILDDWKCERGENVLDDDRTELVTTYTDPSTGLQVRCVAVKYADFPVVEWTVHLKNTGEQPTPIIEDVQALDTRLERGGDGEFLLHHSDGSPHSGLAPQTPTQYAPRETELGPETEKRLAAMEGLPAGGDLPYFNIECHGEGIIFAVGWLGQWAAQFNRDSVNGLNLRIGQELTHFRLMPGEEVRTPLIAMLFWEGDWIRSQNLWRRWMIRHNLPRPGGKLPPPQLEAGGSAQYIEMSLATEENQIEFVDRYFEEGIEIDYWWMDAGWYIFRDYWLSLGTWEPDPERFPRGLRPISDHVHSKGAKVILWFVPERADPGEWLYENHPEWLLGINEGRKLLDFGNPEAWEWAVNHFDSQFIEQGADLFRMDGDGPLPFWRANDTEDRQGITEIRHLEGILAFWDELRRRHPDMLMDICAGGGARNALEALRRAVPLWRSDYAYEPTGMQNLTFAMSLWIPYFGTGTNAFESYTFRSQMAPAVSCIWDMRRRDVDYTFQRRMVAEWRQVAGNYYGDYYPLTAYRTESDVWAAWQFDRPESGRGIVQAFRRQDSDITQMCFKLRGLDPSADYTITNMDIDGSTRITGKDLTENGLSITIDEKPGAVLIVYEQTL